MMSSALEQQIETLPLVAAQSGIWMADQLSPQANAWSVAHYVELNGVLNEALLCKAIVAGMKEADTLCMRFSEVDGEARQWLDPHASFTTPHCHDLRNLTILIHFVYLRTDQDLTYQR